MSEAPLTVCPECNEAELTKLVSAAGFQLKGEGWYVTDFKNKKKPEAKTANKEEKKVPAEKPTKKESE